jgi:galactokinase
MTPDIVDKKFKELFREEPLLVRSPGRVNLIGEHTDYNMGFVLPGAIDKAIYFAIAPRADQRVHLYATDLQDSCEFTLKDLVKTRKNWPNYLMGVIDQLTKAGCNLKGFNCVFGGDIPLGAGLSSSAAVEAGLAFSLNHLFELGINKLDIVKLSQKSENEFVGVQCGIMDQYINIFGEADNVLRIDCRSLEYEYLPFEYKDISIVLFNTHVSHSLASTEYNQRRRECLEGVSIIKQDCEKVQSLRDVTLEMLEQYKIKLDPVVYRRCKYAVEENVRVLKGCDALKENDLKTFGQYMFQTHTGLSVDYEVSCKELDYLVDLVKNNRAVYGSRVMGGGFGGCTINLIEKNAVNDIGEMVIREYKKKFNLDASMYITSIGAGTNIVRIEEQSRV